MPERDIASLRHYTYELAGDYGLGHSLRLIALIRLFAEGRPFVLEAAKKMAMERVGEMEYFLRRFGEESLDVL